MLQLKNGKSYRIQLGSKYGASSWIYGKITSETIHSETTKSYLFHQHTMNLKTGRRRHGGRYIWAYTYKHIEEQIIKAEELILFDKATDLFSEAVIAMNRKCPLVSQAP